MKIIREEFEGDDVYALGKESDDTISFTVVQPNCHISVFFNIREYCEVYLVGFTLESLIKSVQDVQPSFFINFIESTVDSFLHRKGCQKHEAYIFAHQLFAKEFRFKTYKEEEFGEGYVLGMFGDYFSVRFRESLYGAREFCFNKRFYKQFFSTKIKGDFTEKMLNAVSSEDLLDKFYDYFVRGMITKDTPAIKRALLPFQRKEKIKSILND